MNQAAGTPPGRVSPRTRPSLEIVTEFDQEEDYSGMQPLAASPLEPRRPEFTYAETPAETTAAPVEPSPAPAAVVDRTTIRAARSSPQEEDMKDWSCIKDTFTWVGFKQRDADAIHPFWF